MRGSRAAVTLFTDISAARQLYLTKLRESHFAKGSVVNRQLAVRIGIRVEPAAGLSLDVGVGGTGVNLEVRVYIGSGTEVWSDSARETTTKTLKAKLRVQRTGLCMMPLCQYLSAHWRAPQALIILPTGPPLPPCHRGRGDAGSLPALWPHRLWRPARSPPATRFLLPCRL